MTGYKPGTPDGPDSCKGKPNKFTGPGTARPTSPRKEQPSFLSQRSWEPDLRATWRLLDLVPRVRTMPDDPGRALQGHTPSDRRAGQDRPPYRLHDTSPPYLAA